MTRMKRHGFTLMEMITAVSILVLIILGVGVIFRKASDAVSMSQATLEMFSNVRAVQYQMQQDVGGIDRNNGFIVIRSRLDATSGNRWDQVAFVANGTYPHRTGTTGANPMADKTTANAALIWIGQGVMIGDKGWPGAGTSDGPGTSANINDDPRSADGKNNDQDMVLCRRQLLLMSMNGTTANRILVDSTNNVLIAAYADPSIGTTAVAPMDSGDTTLAPISASRVDAVAMTPGQLMQGIATAVGTRTATTRYEADNFCYRSRVLPNPYASSGTIVNGTYRMHSTMLRGTASFAVDWTDGTVDGNGTLQWYGLADAARNVQPKYGGAGTSVLEPSLGNNDGYTAIFSYDKKGLWPKALRFRYRVTDLNNRLNGGREIIQVVRIP